MMFRNPLCDLFADDRPLNTRVAVVKACVYAGLYHRFDDIVRVFESRLCPRRSARQRKLYLLRPEKASERFGPRRIDKCVR